MSSEIIEATGLKRRKRKDSTQRPAVTHDGQGAPLDEEESREILAQCQTMALSRFGKSLAAIWGEVQNSILAMAEEAKDDRDTRNAYIQGADRIYAKRQAIQDRFKEELQAEFEKRPNAVASKDEDEDQDDDGEEDEDDAAREDEFDLSGLTLLDDDDLFASLKVKELSTKLRGLCEKELRALDQRMQILLKDPHLGEKDNPFGPESVYNAFTRACVEIDSDKKLKMAVLGVFDKQVCQDINGIYRDINKLLVGEGVLPKIRYGFHRSSDGGGPSLEDDSESSEEGNSQPGTQGARGGAAHKATSQDTHTSDGDDDDETLTGEESDQDLFAVIKNMMPRPPAGGAGGAANQSPGASARAGAATPVRAISGQELMGALTQIQLGNAAVIQNSPQGLSAAIAALGSVNVLHDIKATSFGQGLNEVDGMTLDIVAMLFDQLLEDRKISDVIKVLIGRLQIPVLKTAILDKALFQNKAHPARCLLNTLGEIGLGLGPDFLVSHPLYKLIEAAMQRLIDRFEQDVSLFGKTEAVLNQLVETENRRVAEAAQHSTRQIENRERLQVGRALAQREVRRRMKSGHVPPAVQIFLATEWIKFLIIAYAKVGPTGAAWKSSMEIMDQLIWSVEPKSTAEDQRKLANALPSLLKHLERGMDLIGTSQDTRTKFLFKLMRHHTEVISGEAAKTRTGDASAQTGSAPKDGPASASGGEGALSESLSTEHSLTINNPFGEGQIEVEEISLDFLPDVSLGVDGKDNPQPAKTGDKYSRKAQKMAVGTWVEMRTSGDAKIHARLSWVSPLRSTFVFTNRLGTKVAELSIYLLAKDLREGNCKVMKDVPIFDRAMSAVVGVLRKNNEASLQLP
jgi:Protein of unknown function (DUF1631)